MAIHSIPPGLPFVDALAEGLLRRAGGDPLALTHMLVLLPTRRAGRALQDAFLRRTDGRPLLLPRMMPLGEMDFDETGLALENEPGFSDWESLPAIAPLRRQLLLARLVMAGPPAPDGTHYSPDQAVRLAGELAGFLDQAQTERLSFAALKGLAADRFAAHWQTTLEFLKLVTEAWPNIVAEEGALDPARRRDLVLTKQAQAWLANPPAYPVVAAGSTGSVPAVADLLAAIAKMPQGAVVLPGLDPFMDDAAWDALEESHPQFGMKKLLERMETDRTDVAPWDGADIFSFPQERVKLISLALRPAAVTEAWREKTSLTHHALAGVSRIDAPGPRELAASIALALREALEIPERTAALVTPDRDLARRVAAEMARFGVSLDDSAGRPLDHAPPGLFLRLIAEAAVEDFAPMPLLALLKHPLAAGRRGAGATRNLARKLERAVLRGPRPAPGWDGVLQALQKSRDADADLKSWAQEWAEDTQDFCAALDAALDLRNLFAAHVACAERLAGAGNLWAGEAGEALSAFAADLLAAADGGALPKVDRASYSDLLTHLMRGVAVRPRYGSHPRVHVWGPLEARLQQADLVVLAGLNEGVWPATVEADAWMSRPMRASFGLPAPERRIGLSAHDFAQLFCAPQVVLARAEKQDGAPTVPSRWLLRLDAVLDAAGISPAKQPGRSWSADFWIDWQQRLDESAERTPPLSPPAPRPPVTVRPMRLSVTEIETWRRDPYAIYARHILRLEALDILDADPAAADYGSAVHAALEDFVKAYPQTLPKDAEEKLLAMGREAFADLPPRPGVTAFWWPRFVSIARWYLVREQAAAGRIARRVAESKGQLRIATPSGDFLLTGKADRIDILNDGQVEILDYKTGSVPSAKEVAAGYAPQLPLEAAMAMQGAFPGIPAAKVAALRYVRLKGGASGGEEREAGAERGPDSKSAEDLAREALEGLKALIAAFAQPETPYEARPHPSFAPRYSDYGHLARLKEWQNAGEEE